MITLDRDIKQPVDPELLLDELRRRARQADERVGLDVMEVAGDHEQVERVAELAVRERAQAVGGDDRVGRARAGDDDRERVLPPSARRPAATSAVMYSSWSGSGPVGPVPTLMSR